MPQYIALIQYDQLPTCRVTFPDFPQCSAEMEGLERAIDAATTVLRYHIKELQQRGQDVPPARTITEIRSDPGFGHNPQRSIVTFITYPPVPRPLQRISVELDVDLLDAIDRVSADYGLTRSGFLSRAAAVMLAENGGVNRVLRPPRYEDGYGEEEEEGSEEAKASADETGGMTAEREDAAVAEQQEQATP